MRQAALEHGAREVTVVDRETEQVKLEAGESFDEDAFSTAVKDLGYTIEPVEVEDEEDDYVPS